MILFHIKNNKRCIVEIIFQLSIKNSIYCLLLDNSEEGSMMVITCCSNVCYYGYIFLGASIRSEVFSYNSLFE